MNIFCFTHPFQKHPKFDAIVVALGLQKRGTAGEHTEAVDDIYDLSNAARLKSTEVKPNHKFVPESQILKVLNGKCKLIADCIFDPRVKLVIFINENIKNFKKNNSKKVQNGHIYLYNIRK